MLTASKARLFSTLALAALVAGGALTVGCKPRGGNQAGGQGASASPDGGNRGGDRPAGGFVREERTFLTPVMVQAIARGEIRSTVATTGSVVPYRTTALRAEESGRLRFTQTFKEGDAVKTGDLIATIESETLEREIALSFADVQLQKETLDIGEKTMRARVREYQTLQDLYSRGIAAQKDVDSQRLEMERSINQQRQNQISLAKAESELQEKLNRKERLEVRAPFDGILVSRPTLEGQGKFTRGFGSESVTEYEGRNVSAAQTICGLVDISSVYMRCDVTSKDIASVYMGQEADVVVYSREDIVRPGKVVDISDSVDPDTRAFRVDVLVENADGELKPGMFGRSEIVTERRRDTISVPKSVVLRRNNQDVVFIADKEADAAHAIARQVPVETGLQGKDEVEILLGLESGQMLVVRGYEVLQDRTPVNAIDVDEPIVPEEPKEPEAQQGMAGGGSQQGGGGGSRRGGGGGRRG